MQGSYIGKMGGECGWERCVITKTYLCLMADGYNITLSKDTIWDFFQGVETIDKFKSKLVNPIYLKKQVPDDIKEAALIIEKLLICSYYEYGFIDIALTEAIFLLEKTLKIKWFEIHNTKAKLNLEKLITWFQNEGYFETWSDAPLHQLRNIRNRKVHRTEQMVLGIGFIKRIYEVFDFINGLFEDKQLRIERKSKVEDLRTQFDSFIKDGTILSYKSKRYIVFTAFPLFINNKTDSHTLCLYICPIFDLAPYTDNNYSTPWNFTISLKDWEIKDSKFTGTDVDTSELVSLTLINEKNKDKYSGWKNELMGLPNWDLVTYSASEPLDKYFLNCVRELHQID